MILGYGPGGIRVRGGVYASSVLVCADGVFPWSGAVGLENLPEKILELAPLIKGVDLLLVGIGEGGILLSPAERGELRSAGFPQIEVMGFSAACRTFSVLGTEGRRVAAALAFPF